jgi:hypothetical protein
MPGNVFLPAAASGLPKDSVITWVAGTWIATGLGWALATLLIAGYTGLERRQFREVRCSSQCETPGPRQIRMIT